MDCFIKRQPFVLWQLEPKQASHVTRELDGRKSAFTRRFGHIYRRIPILIDDLKEPVAG